MSSPGRYTTVRPRNSRSLIAFSVLPLVDGYRKNALALAPRENRKLRVNSQMLDCRYTSYKIEKHIL